MKIGEIFGKIAHMVKSPIGEALTAVIPGAGGAAKIIGVINNLAGGDAINEDTPVGEVSQKIASLPPDKQAEIYGKDIELEIVREQEWTKVVQAIADGDSKGNTLRPQIARDSFRIAAFITLAACVLYCYVIGKNGLDHADHALQVALGFTILATPFVTTFLSYFGIRTKEKTNKIRAAMGHEVDPNVTGLVGKLVKVFS